jgi:hypothetical protein
MVLISTNFVSMTEWILPTRNSTGNQIRLTTTLRQSCSSCRPALCWLDRTRRVVQRYGTCRTVGNVHSRFPYTSNRGGTISVDVNGKDVTGPLLITTTNDPADPLAWRQWHHWNLAPQLFKVRLSKGKNVLTVHILTNGNMNLAYFDFKPVQE